MERRSNAGYRVGVISSSEDQVILATHGRGWRQMDGTTLGNSAGQHVQVTSTQKLLNFLRLLRAIEKRYSRSSLMICRAITPTLPLPRACLRHRSFPFLLANAAAHKQAQSLEVLKSLSLLTIKSADSSATGCWWGISLVSLPLAFAPWATISQSNGIAFVAGGLGRRRPKVKCRVCQTRSLSASMSYR